ncbi:btb/poz domain-containing protein [Quercus suber]|uniref:Btb/poz domain-containing protein n=1 Tax=Quercus suber TaxID=58331 RepID=A0AAW0IJS0_QUESU
MDLSDKQQQQLSLAQCARQRCNEWFVFCSGIFRDVPSDITIEVSGGTFSLHKVMKSRRKVLFATEFYLKCALGLKW